ncbi:hypothetical protein [Aquimarina algicola]|uniref:Uncharacterized protein n=1 Tax=Aquimarina algicola TaxID=2589995 RepID=A0A504JHN5_9FLAO|nr:hypothetical protein [Aquimarina algicola]TPN85980.1 hypothetical protein FHK87_11910 [Aquimarina algicola]
MKNIYTVFLFCVLILANSCKTKTENNSSTDATTVKETSVEETSVEGTTIDAQTIISSPSGEQIGGFTLEPLTVYAAGSKYMSKSKPDKHKFYTNGSMVYEVKLKAGDFKLRDSKSNLLWKIKVYPDKVKVSNNEENENAFEIKKYEDKIKIKQDENTVYEVQLGDSSIAVNDEVLYQFSSDESSYAYAVLAINEIPEDQRIFILAELLKQL